MYIKVIDGNPVNYGLGELRKENPSISFPSDIPLETLAEYDIYPAEWADPPAYDLRTHNLKIKDYAELIDGKWIYNWELIPKTEEEIQDQYLGDVEAARRRRNNLLTECDWTQLSDAPVDSAAWANYRQSLRDITTHEKFPLLDDSDWPVAP